MLHALSLLELALQDLRLEPLFPGPKRFGDNKIQKFPTAFTTSRPGVLHIGRLQVQGFQGLTRDTSDFFREICGCKSLGNAFGNFSSPSLPAKGRVARSYGICWPKDPLARSKNMEKTDTLLALASASNYTFEIFWSFFLIYAIYACDVTCERFHCSIWSAKRPQCSPWRNPPCYVEWLVPHLVERHSSGESLHAGGTKSPPFFLS